MYLMDGTDFDPSKASEISDKIDNGDESVFVVDNMVAMSATMISARGKETVRADKRASRANEIMAFDFMQKWNKAEEEFLKKVNH